MMFPVLLEIGPIKIYSFGFMLVIAFYTCYFLLNSDLKRFGYEPKLASDMVFWAAIGGIFGAKIYYILEHLSDTLNDPIGMICLLYTSPSPRDATLSRMPSSA